MRAIALKCPNCHANLEATDSAHKITCTYCGTQARVQHRTRYLERKIPLPRERTTNQPAQRSRQQRMPVAQQRHGWRWLSVMSSIIPLTGAGIAVYFAIEGAGGFDKVGDVLGEARDAVTGESMTYGGYGNALFQDINDDGHLDIIGTTRYVQNNDSYHIAAFDGLTGSKLWESETFGDHGDASSGITTLHAKTIVQSDNRGNITGFSATDGSRVFKVPVGEKVKEACATDEESVALKLSDKSWKSVLLKDGTLTPLEGAPEDCKQLSFQDRYGDSRLSYSSQNRRARRVRTKVDGMAVRELVTLKEEPGHQIALGNKAPGTRIPMVAYLRVDSPAESEESDDSAGMKKKRKARKRGKSKRAKPKLVWSSELPALDPLSAKEGPPKFVAVSQGYVAALYAPKSGSEHLVCFTREGGQRLWDVALPGKVSALTAIDIAGERVYVTQWGRLDAFDVAKGSHSFSLGN
jgi:outer membrane protein assembly factor BamB